MDTDTQTGRMLCEGEGRYWGDASKRKPEVANKPPGVGERPGTGSSSALRRTQPCRHLDLRPAASRTGEDTFMLFKPAVCDALSRQPQQTDVELGGLVGKNEEPSVQVSSLENLAHVIIPTPVPCCNSPPLPQLKAPTWH